MVFWGQRGFRYCEVCRLMCSEHQSCVIHLSKNPTRARQGYHLCYNNFRKCVKCSGGKTRLGNTGQDLYIMLGNTRQDLYISDGWEFTFTFCCWLRATMSMNRRNADKLDYLWLDSPIISDL